MVQNHGWNRVSQLSLGEKDRQESLRVHGIFTTSKNISAVFLAIWFYNCEFDKIMTTYCHIHCFMSNLHLTL